MCEEYMATCILVKRNCAGNHQMNSLTFQLVQNFVFQYIYFDKNSSDLSFQF